MTEDIANLVNALRQELECYNEMLALLDRQQRQIGARRADEVLQTIAPVKQQGLLIQDAQAHRDNCRAQLALALQRARNAPFAELISVLPEPYRGELAALVRENNDLLIRVRQRARQNHLCLSRSIELIQSLVNAVCPGRVSRTYTGGGITKFRRVVASSVYEAVC
jgi:flagellar biosynthesis/type III secretory pathway chaperone